MKLNDSLQKILPFGYLILVVLGIIKESIFYYFLGVNILKYSTIMDILISPISDLTSHPIILFGFITYTIAIYVSFSWMSNNYDKAWVKKIVKLKGDIRDLSEDEIKNKFSDAFISIFTVCLFSFFLGVGIGSGSGLRDKIQQNKLKHEHILTFNTNESKDIYLIGSNSINYFYMEKGSKNISISPIGAVKKIEILGKKNKAGKK